MINFIRSLIFIAFFALLGPNMAYAEQLNDSVKDWYSNSKDNSNIANTDTETGKVDNSPSKVGVTFFDFIKMIIATIFVIALLYLVLRFVNKKNRSFQASQLIENLGGTSLGANRSVQIVKVGSQIMVLGVGENIQLLKEISDNEESKKLLETYNNKLESLIQPNDIISKVMDRVKSSKNQNPEENKFASLLKNQLSELNSGRKELLKEIEKEGSDKR